jgi:CheY-like chemotaxis protein
MTRILVVDDEPDMELLFKQKFRREIKAGELAFSFAFNGPDALAFLRTLQPLDLVMVLSDINMPGMTGLELLEIIRTDFPALRVMMVTAYGDEKNYNKAMQLGAYDFMTKPVDFSKIREKILEVQAGK